MSATPQLASRHARPAALAAFSSDRFVLPLPDGHRFPMTKYRLLRERVVAEGLVRDGLLREAPPASDEEIERVHDPHYWRQVQSGGLAPAAIRALGFPWSPELVERSRRSVGATVAAARSALATDGARAAVNLAGGTHHAFADRGEGYCVLNDVAVAARAMQDEGRCERVLVIDCDVHQGNGTAALFERDDTVFTLSLHGRRNYPARKQHSDLDVALEDGTGDAEYLERLGGALEQALAHGPFGLVFYVAGADPFVGDRLGRLALSKTGLARRDELVVAAVHRTGLPLVVVMGGGYAEDVSDIVDIHLGTVRVVCSRYGDR